MHHEAVKCTTIYNTNNTTKTSKRLQFLTKFHKQTLIKRFHVKISKKEQNATYRAGLIVGSGNIQIPGLNWVNFDNSRLGLLILSFHIFLLFLIEFLMGIDCPGTRYTYTHKKSKFLSKFTLWKKSRLEENLVDM